MSKRADGKFPRDPDNFYPTPAAAIPFVLPLLRRDRVRTFSEPCVGDYSLVRAVEHFGIRCVQASDLKTGTNALDITHFLGDAVITNPPYDESRRVMHALIGHFTKAGQTYLLLPSDWAMTSQATPYLNHCSDIVAVGRLKTMGEDTASAGFDNYCWARFDPTHVGGPQLHARGPARRRKGQPCRRCGELFKPQRSTGQFCTNGCRQRAYRDRLAVTDALAGVTLSPARFAAAAAAVAVAAE